VAPGNLLANERVEAVVRDELELAPKVDELGLSGPASAGVLLAGRAKASRRRSRFLDTAALKRGRHTSPAPCRLLHSHEQAEVTITAPVDR